MSNVTFKSGTGGGGGVAVDRVAVQAATAPGTNPVLATAGGQITVNGTVVAAHSIPIRTDSLAANTLNVEMQYAAAVGATDATKVGLASFDSASFAVDANGFVTFTGGSSSFTWSVITADQTAAVNNGYICNKGSALLLTLPATASVGNIIRVTGINTALGWKIVQNANQQIFFGNTSTTLGATGFIQSSATRDSIELVCVVGGASTVYNVISSIGNPTIA